MIDLFGQIFLYFDFNVPQQSSFKSNKQLIVMRIFYSHFAWCLVFQRLGYCISISGLWIRIFLTPNFYARYFCNCQLRLNKWQRLLLYRNEIILKAKLQTICCFVSLEKTITIVDDCRPVYIGVDVLSVEGKRLILCCSLSFNLDHSCIVMEVHYPWFSDKWCNILWIRLILQWLAILMRLFIYFVMPFLYISWAWNLRTSNW